MKNTLGILGKNTIIYGFGSVFSRLISLLLLPLFTSYLTPVDYGILGLITFISVMIQPVFSLGLGAAIGPCYFEESTEKRKKCVIWNSFFVLLLSTFILVFIGLQFSDSLSLLILKTASYNDLVILSMLTIAISNLSIPFTSYMQFENKAFTFIIISSAVSILTIGLNIVTVVGLKWGPSGILVSQLIGSVTSTLLFIVLSKMPLYLTLDITIIKKLLHLGLPFVPSFLCLFLLTQSNRYMLQWFHGLEEVGIYSIGFNLGMVMNVIITAIQKAWYPFFNSYITHQEDAKDLFGRIFTYYSIGVGTLCICFFIFSKLVVLLLTQPVFYEASKIVGFSATAQYLTGMFIMLLPVIYFAKKLQYVTLIQFQAALLQIVLGILIVPSLQSLGAAVTLAAGTLFMVLFLLLHIYIKKNHYLVIHYEIRRIMLFFAIFIIIASLSLLSNSREWWFLLGEAITFSCILIIALWFLVSKTEKMMLRHYVFVLKNKLLGR